MGVGGVVGVSASSGPCAAAAAAVRIYNPAVETRIKCLQQRQQQQRRREATDSDGVVPLQGGRTACSRALAEPLHALYFLTPEPSRVSVPERSAASVMQRKNCGFLPLPAAPRTLGSAGSGQQLLAEPAAVKPHSAAQSVGAD